MRLSLLSALLAVCAYGQTSTGAISGRVVDPTGAAIAGAEIRLTNQVLMDTRTLKSTGEGDFLFLEVQPGTYTISVKIDGFKSYEKRDLQLSASDRLSTGEIKLSVGA